MLEIKNVSKSYGSKKVLDNINLKVKEGQIFGFIGENGAGKTTLIKSIVGIHDFDSGDILINNISIKKDPVTEISITGSLLLFYFILYLSHKITLF